MNKKILAVAVAAALVLPVAANAGAKVYGQVHIALEQMTVADNDATTDVNGTSSKANKLGVKGSSDTNLMDFKAIYKFEMGLNMEANSPDAKVGEGIYYQRDTWLGLSSKSLGTVRAGTIKTPWKATSGLVDPLFTTAFESRGGSAGIGGASKNLAGGKGVYRGRATSTVRYDSPSVAGAKVFANYGFAAGKDALGLGVLYKMGGMSAFFNYASTDVDLTAMKVGAKMKMGAIGVSGAYEIDGGAIAGVKDGTKNQLTVVGTYGMGASTVILKYSMTNESTKDAKNGRSGFVLAVSQKVAKKTSIYAGYGASSATDTGDDMSTVLLGMKAGF